MAAGKYRQVLVVEENRVSEKTDLGEQESQWTKLAERRAMVSPLTARQVFLARQAQSYATHLVEMRFDADLGLSPLRHRLRVGNRIFYLEGPPRDVEERHAIWQMNAVERVEPTEV